MPSLFKELISGKLKIHEGGDKDNEVIAEFESDGALMLNKTILYPDDAMSFYVWLKSIMEENNDTNK